MLFVSPPVNSAVVYESISTEKISTLRIYSYNAKWHSIKSVARPPPDLFGKNSPCQYYSSVYEQQRIMLLKWYYKTKQKLLKSKK